MNLWVLRRYAACLILSLGLLTGAANPTLAAASGDPGERRPAAPDPAVLRGKLSNGMRYAVMRNATPTSAVSIRFYVESGSLAETEPERGVAHFLEHMAFDGGARIAGDVLSAKFQAAGVSMDRDRNAFTSPIGTYYVLDLQQVTGPKLDLAFSWLRDVADGLALDPAAVERERGVVTSEYYARRDGGTDVGEALYRFLQPEMMGPKRSPGGTPVTLSRINADMLRSFYQHWYRPERAFIIIVGDQPPEAMVARVEATFRDWKAQTPRPPEPEVGRIDLNRPTDAFEINTPNFAQGLIEFCRFAAADPHLAPSIASWRAALDDAGWMLPLQQRLDHRSRNPETPFLNARVERLDLFHRYSVACVHAAPKPDRWQDALATLSDEMRSLQLYGVAPSELDTAMTSLKAQVDAAASAARQSSQLAQGLIQTLLDDDPAVTPTASAKLFDAARSRVTPETALAAFRRRWSEAAPPQLALISVAPSSREALLSAWQADQAKPPPAKPQAAAPPVWAYRDFGPPGQVTAREVIAEPAFVRVTFANGVVANIKTLTAARDHVDIRVRFGAGQLEIPHAQLILASLGASHVVDGGLGRHDAEALERLIDARAVTLGYVMNRDHFLVGASSRAADADFAAQALAALLTDPGFRPEAAKRIPEAVKSFYTSLKVEPDAVVQQALRSTLVGPPVFELPPQAAAEALTMAEVERLLRPAMTQAQLEVTVVGDITEAQAVALLAQSFGALPSRGGWKDRALPDAPRIHYPDKTPVTATLHHRGLPSKASVVTVWPLFPWVIDRQREVRALTLLREVLGDRVRRTIRERLGQTYTPSVSLTDDRGGDQGSLTVAIDTNPAAAQRVVDEICEIARALSRGEVTSEELERVRKPLLDDTANRRETAAWWLNTLDGSASDPTHLQQARSWQKDYSTIPVTEVNAAARKWLTAPPVVAMAVPNAISVPAH